MDIKIMPKRPYLLRAYYEWLSDSDLTPYLVVDAEYSGVNVPVEYVRDGQIVLNLSENATASLLITNEAIQFSARFQGITKDIYIPMGAALAIYARENGDGVMFEPEHIYESLNEDKIEQPISFEEATDQPKKTSNNKKAEVNKKTTKSASHLRIIK